MSAVDEFREYVGVPGSHYLPVLAVVDKARRAVAELEAERDAWHEQRDAEYEAWALAQARAEELEAEFTAPWHIGAREWRERIAALEATIKRLTRSEAGLKDELSNRCAVIERLDAELTEFRAAVSGHDLKAVNTRLVNDNLGLRDEIEQAEATIESLSAEKAREKQRRIQAEAELAKRRRESTNDEVLVEEYRSALAAAREELKAHITIRGAEPPAWSPCVHDWDYSQNSTAGSAKCRKCGAFKPVEFPGSTTTCWQPGGES